MAIDLTVQYPGKIGPASGPYPYGEPRNVTTPGDGTGTPWEAAIVKDFAGVEQALLSAAGIVPSGSPDAVGASQYLQSIVEQVAGRAQTYIATGTGDAIVLTQAANQEPIQSLYTGLIIDFVATATNTTNVTINVAGLGVVAFNNNQNGIFLAGQIQAGEHYRIRYNGTNFVMDQLRLYMLDTIEIALALTGGAATVATAVSVTTLDNVNAKSAVLNCKLFANILTTGIGYNRVDMFVGNSNAITTNPTNVLLTSRIESQVAATATLSDAQNTQFTVGLDSNHDFWYIQLVDDQAGGQGTESRGFQLVGYWA